MMKLASNYVLTIEVMDQIHLIFKQLVNSCRLRFSPILGFSRVLMFPIIDMAVP